MSRRVWATPQAEAQAHSADAWWREHREASPELFREELVGAVDMLASAPEIGRLYPEGGVSRLRRLLLPKSRYGKMVMADAQSKSIYEEAARARGVPVFSLTVADFFQAPSVDEVDLSAYAGQVGDRIVVRASDNFDVVGVNVSLADGDGNAIEWRRRDGSIPGWRSCRCW